MRAVVLWLTAAAASLLRSRGVGSGDGTRASAPYRQRLENFQNTQYFGDFKIGPHSMKAIFDTGSFEVLVLSSRCKHCVNKPYDYATSSTYQKNGTLVKHVFGSGPVLSQKAFDDVEIGQFHVKQQVFWEIIEHRIPVLDYARFSAIVGIGPGHAPTNNDSTLLMSINVNTIAICLEKHSGAPGWLTWGDDTPKGNFAAVPVVGDLHWGVAMTKVGMLRQDGTRNPVPFVCEGGCAAIVDSGTSLIALPTSHLDAVLRAVGPIHHDCSNVESLPTLTFVLGDKVFELPPKAYIMRIQQMPMGSALLQKLAVPANMSFVEKSESCMPAFMRMDKASKHGPVWILGSPFLRHYYTQFDRSEREMRFAPAGPGCVPKPYPNKEPSSGALLAHLDSYVEAGEDRLPPVVDLQSVMQPMWSMDASASVEL